MQACEKLLQEMRGLDDYGQVKEIDLRVCKNCNSRELVTTENLIQCVTCGHKEGV